MDVAVRVEPGSGVKDGSIVGMFFCPLQAVRSMQAANEMRNVFFISLFCKEQPNGRRYRRIELSPKNYLALSLSNVELTVY